MSIDAIPPDYPQPEPEGDEQNSDYSASDESEEGLDDDSSAVG